MLPLYFCVYAAHIYTYGNQLSNFKNGAQMSSKANQHLRLEVVNRVAQGTNKHTFILDPEK